LNSKTNTSNRESQKETKNQRLGQLPESIRPELIKERLQGGLFSFWKNKRLRWGLLLLLVFAPLSKFIYLILPNEIGEYIIDIGIWQLPNTIEGEENGWYWGTIRMYLFANGELMAPTLSVLGIFLLFPKKYLPAYLSIIPFGYYLALLTYRMVIVDSDQTYLAGPSVIFMVPFFLFGIVLFTFINKFLSRKDIVKQAIVNRITSLIKAKNIQWVEKEIILNEEVDQMIEGDNEMFNK